MSQESLITLPSNNRQMCPPQFEHRPSLSSTTSMDKIIGSKGVTNPAYINDEEYDSDNLLNFSLKTKHLSATLQDIGVVDGQSRKGNSPTDGVVLDATNLPDPWDKVRLNNVNRSIGFRESMLHDSLFRNSVNDLTLKGSSLTRDNESTEKRRTWDVFRLLPNKDDKATHESYFNTFEKMAKIVVSILMTIALILFTLISKSCLLLITSNLFINVTLNCKTLYGVQHCTRIPFYQNERIEFKPSKTVRVKWLWALIIVVCAPYLLTFLRCMWKVCFKKTRKIGFGTFSFVMIIETLQTIGMTMFAFLVLPNLDAMRGEALMLGGAIIPALLKMFDKETATGKSMLTSITDFLAIIAQVSVLIIWPVIEAQNGRTRLAYFIPISLFLISLSWWENYINQYTMIGTALSNQLRKLKRNVRRMRARIYLVVGVWKLVLTISLVTAAMSEGDMGCLKLIYFRDANANNVTCSGLSSPPNNVTREIDIDVAGTPYWIAIIQVVSCLFCYSIARNACKMMLQVTSFSIPLAISPPIIIAFFMGNCESWLPDQSYNWLNKDYLFWTCDMPGNTSSFIKNSVLYFYFPVVIAWWMSYLWVTVHIWYPKVERLVQTERLFVQTFYCDVFLQHSLTINRRRDDRDRDKASKKIKGFECPTYNSSRDPVDLLLSADSMRTDTTPLIYVCATMWHETEKETLNILTSIFRMDVDQSARRNAQRFFDVVDPDYYEFEGHIFFDDAFDSYNPDDNDCKVNSYVKQLIEVMDQSASIVHRVQLKLTPPALFDTPYGGRLEWYMPGGNRLIAHLKDKQKIRHRKRWSQVMYMYYFLGYRLLGQPMKSKRKQTIADNTFLLALDGDVDFKPEALQLLVDRMRKSDKVAAACGRIHPKGSGPVLWYQKFEYAISHWLQKATEHMIGCVMCSPGCFSLFRGSALMDDNVMRRYAIPPTEARHFVQYDQGEDRWLCTLLLQQGYRVEYCAASDAMTFAPEGFNEFFNQRRRWAPSTMANIMDLLQDWRNVIKVNENISGLYILYQLLLFVSSILTPGTIFLLIVGAISTAFPSILLIESLFINLVPICLFVLSCFFLSSEVQLLIAGVMSCVYTLVMTLVLVGLALQMSDEGICSPTTIFFIFMIGIFLIAGILHPQEFFNLLHGPVYFLTIPTTGMLMMVYSVCNLNVVSWGTRETKQADETDTKDIEKSKALEGNKWWSFLSKLPNLRGENSDYVFTFGNLFKCLCCLKSVEKIEDLKMNAIMEKLDKLEKAMQKMNIDGTECSSFEDISSTPDGDPSTKNATLKDIVNSDENEISLDEFLDTNMLKKDEEKTICVPLKESMLQKHDAHSRGLTLWQVDLEKITNKIRFISRNEWEFWEELIAKYLHPIEKDEEKQARIEQDLLALRNQVCLFFFLFNGLFIVIIFTLQYINARTHGKGLAIPLPCVSRTGNDLTIEPISLLFMIIFGIALTIQFMAMAFHRLGTFTHIIASTEVNCLRPNQSEKATMDIYNKIQLVRELQSHNKEDDDSQSLASVGTLESVDDTYHRSSKKKTVINIMKNKNKQESSNDLRKKFVINFMKLADDMRNDDNDVDLVEDSNIKLNNKNKNGLKLKKKQSLYALAKLRGEKDVVLNKADLIKERHKHRSKSVSGAPGGNGGLSGSIGYSGAFGAQLISTAERGRCDLFREKNDITLSGDMSYKGDSIINSRNLNMISEEESMRRSQGSTLEEIELNVRTEENKAKLKQEPTYEEEDEDKNTSKTNTLETISADDGNNILESSSIAVEIPDAESDIQLVSDYFDNIDDQSTCSNSDQDNSNL